MFFDDVGNSWWYLLPPSFVRCHGPDMQQLVLVSRYLEHGRVQGTIPLEYTTGMLRKMVWLYFLHGSIRLEPT